MKSIVAILVVLLVSSVAFAQGGSFTGIYKFKHGGDSGTLKFSETSAGAKFTIDSSGGQDMCNVEVLATKVDANRFAFTSNDNDDNCTVVFNFSKAGTVTITSKDCRASCGNHAGFDGTYK